MFSDTLTHHEPQPTHTTDPMTTIASPQNPRLKALRRLHAGASASARGTFLAEGEDLVAAAEAAGRRPLEGYRLAGTALGGAGFHDVDAGSSAAPRRSARGPA